MAASTIEECDRLLDMINTMLMISKTEAGVDRPSLEDIDIGLLLGIPANYSRLAQKTKV
jgi:signal transduction histidine kinase